MINQDPRSFKLHLEHEEHRHFERLNQTEVLDDYHQQGPDLNLLPVASENEEEDIMNQAFVHEHSAVEMLNRDGSKNEDALSVVQDRLSILDVQPITITEELKRDEGQIGRKTHFKTRLWASLILPKMTHRRRLSP